MKVDGIEVREFRNLAFQRLEPCDGVNVLYGQNGQGKTNLLEAVWLFTGSKSFRGGKDAEMIPFGREKAELFLQFTAQEREQTARILFHEKKQVELNAVKQKSISALQGAFCAMIFAPPHLSLVKDGAQQRRRFLDGAICQIRPKFLSAVVQYQKILAQRNALLKEIPRHAGLMDTLPVWDERLAALGGYIAVVRMQYMERLSREAAGIYHGLSGEKERLSLSYQCSFSEKREKEKLSADFLNALKATLKEDIGAGFTTKGVHRDDFNIQIDGLCARTYGSQGQQRSCVLALKLAEGTVLQDNIGEKPVCLLDDVMSELDGQRQDYILNHIQDWQVFITCCNPDTLRGLQNGKTFVVEDGTITEKD